MANDNDRGPGVPTITWVTLGLLVFSIITAVIEYVLLFATLDRPHAARGACYTTYMTFPITLITLAAWLGRQQSNVPALAMYGAVLYAVQATAIIAGRTTGLIGPVAAVVGGVFFVGWPLAIVTNIIVARNRSRRPPSD